MKKIVLNINDNDYEKYRLEALHEGKSIQEIIRQRLEYKSFHEEVLEAFEEWIENNIEKILKE